MKTCIYYVTGTGNTLAVARDLAEELGNTELVSIPAAMQKPDPVADADVIGLAFPVYYLDIPDIVKDFIQTIRISKIPYVFGIATCGEQAGGALFHVKTLLSKKRTELSAGFALVMPENYIGPINLMGDAPRRQEKYANAKSRIPEIADAVRRRKIENPEGSDSGLLRFGGSFMSAIMGSVYRTPRRFHATRVCNRCRICERICPVRNISVTDDAVRWGNDCIQCYACIHWCPHGAIEIGRRTAGKPRYHHPDVTLNDMLYQRGE